MLRIAPLLLSAFLLTACVTNGPSDVIFPAAATTPTAQATPAGEPAAAAAQAAPATQVAAVPAAKRNAPAGRATSAPAVPAESNSDDGPLTITKAREQCWMMSEVDKTAVRSDLDKKVKWVEQCVDKKMNASIGR